ncbi:farnesol dehydrogenase-like [Uranotaenia lowii]|uniref:farnesol dehydrogenase-like n=1 Tax=Uranotaenia lowii TaxID=190385 RepID=UPI00247A3CBE|nr:farnesol dehydrogenase-like [Uranotaenia lowii]
MDWWIGKVVVVTGASSGIGASVAKQLARDGMIMVGMARRVHLIEALKSELSAEAAARFYAIRCDVTKESDILDAFQFIENILGGVDVMINNAGITVDPDVLEAGNGDSLRQIVETNVIGLILGSREAYRSMKARGVAGHIINIGSVLGRRVSGFQRTLFYSVTKFAVRGVTEAIRIELRNNNYKVKVSSISPGIVRTPLIQDIVDLGIQVIRPEDATNRLS